MNVEGIRMPYTPRSSNQILQGLAARLIARSRLNDLSEGSVTTHILATVADDLALQEIALEKIRNTYHFRGCAGSLLDERVSELPPTGLSRLGAGAASGSVMTVTREADVGGGWAAEFVMAAGATFRRSDDGSQTYRTITDYTFGINEGTLSDVWVTATQPGKAGNCALGTINVVDSAESAIIACNNVSPLTNGTSTESDAQLIVRVLGYFSSLAKSQPRALEFAALSYVSPEGGSLRFCHLYEDPVRPGYSEMVVDDGSGLAGTDRLGATTSGTVPFSGQYLIWHEFPATKPIVRIVVTHVDDSQTILGPTDFTSIPERGQIYVPEGVLTPGDVWSIGAQDDVGTQYRVYMGIIAAVQTLIGGSPSSPSRRPGLRAAGTRVRVRPPTLQKLLLDVHITPVSGVALGDISHIVINDIVSFSQALAPGATLYVSQLVDYVMNNRNLMNIRFYRAGTNDYMEDTESLSFYHAIRISGADIDIISAPEE